MTNAMNLNHATRCFFTDFEIGDVLLLDGFFVGPGEEDEVACAYVARDYGGSYLVYTGTHCFFLPKADLRSGKIAASICGHIDSKDSRNSEEIHKLLAA